MKNSIKLGLMLCALCLLAGRIHADDTPRYSALSLTLNGQAVMDNNDVWLTKKGVLAFVEGDPRSAAHKPVSFRATLRRAGKVVRQWPASNIESMYSVQLEDLWQDARLGDELTIEPHDPLKTQLYNNAVKRVIQLRGFNWLSHCLPADNC